MILLGMLLSGTTNTVFNKIQNGIIACGEKYHHPFF
jgi:hypothetical protein